MNVRLGLMVIAALAAMQACGGDGAETDTAGGVLPVPVPEPGAAASEGAGTSEETGEPAGPGRSPPYRIAGSPRAPLFSGATYRFAYSGNTPGFAFEGDAIPYSALQLPLGALIGISSTEAMTGTLPRLALREGGSVSDVAGMASYAIGRWHDGTVDVATRSTMSSPSIAYGFSKDSLHYLVASSQSAFLPTAPLMTCEPEAWTIASIDGVGLADTVIAAAKLQLNGPNSKAYLSITPIIQTIGHTIATPGGILPAPTHGISVSQTWMGGDNTVITPMVFDATATGARLGVVYRHTAAPGVLRGAVVLLCHPA